MKRFINILLCAVAALTAMAQDRLYIDDFEIEPGETHQVSIMLDNSVAFTALQADIFLPEGLQVEEDDGEYLFDLTDRKSRNHTISSTLLNSGGIRILIASQTVKDLSGNSGALVTFNIIASPDFAGQNTITINNVVATEANGTEHQLPDVICTVSVPGEQPPVGGDRLYINDFEIKPGETKQVSIMLDNSVAITALQADIYLPEGLQVEEDDGEYLFDLTDRKSRNHTISSTLLNSGGIRILIASQTVKDLSGNSGALVTFNIIASPDFAGQNTITINNVVATEANGTEHLLPDVTCIVTATGGDTPPEPHGEGVALNVKMARLQLGEQLKLENVTGAEVEWESGDPSIVTVDATGMVTALKSGMAAITATDTKGNSQWCAIWSYLRGDVNEDEVIDVDDVNEVISIILGKDK